MAEIDVIRRILMCCCLRVSIKSINSEGKVEFNKSILADIHSLSFMIHERCIYNCHYLVRRFQYV